MKNQLVEFQTGESGIAKLLVNGTEINYHAISAKPAGPGRPQQLVTLQFFTESIGPLHSNKDTRFRVVPGPENLGLNDLAEQLAPLVAKRIAAQSRQGFTVKA